MERQEITNHHCADGAISGAHLGLVVASLGYFTDASDAAKYLTIGVAAATGILAVISQYAAIP